MEEIKISREQIEYALAACGCLYEHGKTWYEEKELLECLDDLYFKPEEDGKG